jgi:endonuclease/exonuclease/phosphatase family metal-dependent hydrolase
MSSESIPSGRDGAAAKQQKAATRRPKGRIRKLSPDQMARLVQLVANGDLSLLAEVTGEQRGQLLNQVALLRRKRLVEFIAHEIASDIRRSHPQGGQ